MSARRERIVNLSLIVAALMASAIAATTAHSVTTLDREERKGFLLPVTASAAAKRIEIHADGIDLAFERLPTGWKASDGRDVDPSKVDRWLHALDAAKVARPLSENLTPAPPVHVTVVSPAGALALDIGAREAQGGRAVTIDRKDSFFLTEEWASAIALDRDAFRETRVFGFPLADIAEISIAAPAGAISLRRVDNASFVTQDRVLASSSFVREVESTFSDLTFIGFQPPPNDAHDILTFAIKTRAKQEAMLRVGGACPTGRAAQRVAPLPVVDGCIDDAWVKEALDLVTRTNIQEPHLLQSSPDEIGELTFDLDHTHFDIARKGSGFHLRAPEARDLSKEEAALLETFLEERAKETPRAIATPSDLPLLRAAIVTQSAASASASTSERIDFYDVGAKTLAHRSKDGRTFDLGKRLVFPSFALRSSPRGDASP